VTPSLKSQTIGYARVSSSGQNLDVQFDKLKDYGCDNVYHEKISGIDQNRPELIACLNYIRTGDTLVITKLDRIARSALHLGEISKKLENKGVNFVVIDQHIDTSTSQGKLMFNMLASFAEFENDIRKERQLEGINKALSKGIKFGRPYKVTAEDVKSIQAESSNGIPVSEILEQYNISRRTYYSIKSGKHKFCA